MFQKLQSGKDAHLLQIAQNGNLTSKGMSLNKVLNVRAATCRSHVNQIRTKKQHMFNSQ